MTRCLRRLRQGVVRGSDHAEGTPGPSTSITVGAAPATARAEPSWSNIMSWMLAMLAVLAAGSTGTSAMDGAPAPGAPILSAIVDNTQSGRISVHGHAIAVEVQVFRNLMPPIN